MARPKKDLTQKQGKRLGINLTESEHDQLQIKAKESGLSLAEFCRRSALKRKIHSTADAELVRQLSRIGNNLNQVAKHYHEGQPAEQSLRELVSQLRNTLEKLQWQSAKLT